MSLLRPCEGMPICLQEAFHRQTDCGVREIIIASRARATLSLTSWPWTAALKCKELVSLERELQKVMLPTPALFF